MLGVGRPVACRVSLALLKQSDAAVATSREGGLRSIMSAKALVREAIIITAPANTAPAKANLYDIVDLPKVRRTSAHCVP
jgi:hypothetical protein